MSKSLKQSRIYASSRALVLFLAPLLGSTGTFAQQVPGGQDSKPISATATDKTRARRVSQPADEKAVASSETDPVTSSSEPNEAISVLRHQIAAAKTPGEHALLQLRLVDQLVDAGMKREAVAELHTMVAEDRFDPTGFYNMGNRLVRLGDSETAIRAYQKAIEQRNGNYSRALNNLGAVLFQQGRWDEAYDSLSSALRQENFHYAEASFNLGRLYASRGETDLAIREWRRALAANSKHTGAARALAHVRPEGKIRISADTKNQSAIAAKAKPGDSTKAGNPTTPGNATGRPKGNVIARALTVDQETYALLQQARNARERGRNEEAVRYYRNVLSHTGGYFAPANLELSYSLINLKRGDEAIALLIAVSTIDGARYPICYYHLARLYETQGQLKLAEENYSRAAAAYSTNNSQFILDLSRVREKLGDLPGALSALEQYVRAAEKAGRKPDWSDERLAELRKKVAPSSAIPGKP